MSIVHVSNASELIRLNENTYDALQAIEFEAMDTDGDGVVSREEFEAAQASNSDLTLEEE